MSNQIVQNMIIKLFMLNGVDLQVYMIKKIRGIETTLSLDDIDWYDVLHKYLIVSKSYEPIVCRLLDWPAIYLKYWYEVYNVLKGSWNKACERICGVDIVCDSTTLYWWESTIEFGTSCISLE